MASDITERKRAEENLRKTNEQLAATQDASLNVMEDLQRDIIRRKKAEAGLKKAYAELEHSNKELQQFAYVTSHHLQEPLRDVTSYVQLLERRYKGRLDADADEFIRYAVNGTKYMKKLILDFLAYAKLDARNKEFKTVESERTLDLALDNLQTTIKENKAVVTRDSMPAVIADETQLVQLFQNLISNAVKFRRDEAPTVHVSSEEITDEWIFSVRDNGIGIEPEYSELIFGIFQRLHNNEKYQGTGIGLAVCKKIVERHGGRIRVESRPGKGSTFYFSLPKP